MFLAFYKNKYLICIKLQQTTSYLHFSMLLFLVKLTLKDFKTAPYNNPVFTSKNVNFVIMLWFMDLSDSSTLELKNPKEFINFSLTVDDFYKNLEDYNPTKKRTVLIIFDDMIATWKLIKRISPVVSELFFRGTKLNISLVLTS